MKEYEEKRQRFAEILKRCENRWEDAKGELSAVLQEGLDRNDIYLIAAANYWLGVIRYRTGERGEVLPHALKASSFFAESNDYEMSARSYNLLAVVYTTSEEYLLANDAYQKAYDILKEHPCNGFKITSILNNFSANYFHMGDIEKAIEYAEKCLQRIRKDDPDYDRMLFMLGENLSGYYEYGGDLEKAFASTKLMKDAMEHGKCLPEDESCYYVNLSRLSFSSGDVKKGIEYADKVIALGSVDISEHGVQIDYEQIVLALIGISEYERARCFIRFLQDYTEKTGLVSDQLILYRSKAAYADAVGDEKEALSSFRALHKCYEAQKKESLATERYIQKQINDSMEEIRKLWKKVKESEADALTDKLTGFYNLSGTEKYAGLFCKEGSGLLLFLDLDNFKLVNDLYGHQAGDTVLKAFAEILKKRCEEKDILCRIGGDEFLVCMNDSLEEKSIASFADYLNTHFKNACIELLGDDFTIPIGVSVGAVQVPPGGESYQSLFALADKALYQAKQNGKHRYSLYQKEVEVSGNFDPDKEFQRMLMIMSERGMPHEAMTVGQDEFAWIYRYMARFSIRHETNTLLCMLVLNKKPEVAEEAFLDTVNQFQDYLRGNLRRNDVILNRQSNKIFLMLPDLPEENAKAFIDRVTGGWESFECRPAVTISCFFRTTEGRISLFERQ